MRSPESAINAAFDDHVRNRPVHCPARGYDGGMTIALQAMRTDLPHCVGALMVRDGCVLLGRRAAHKTYANRWDVPGGHIEAGETPAQALCRELEEELGICATAWSFHSQHSKHDFVLQLFVVTAWRGEPAALGDEHSEIRWHALEIACHLQDLAAVEYAEVFQSLIDPRARCDPRVTA
jgi:8-oxo-dGTP diphosphatase